MKILIINPNSSPAMTADIDRCAKAFANGEFQVDTVLTPGAPHTSIPIRTRPWHAPE